MRRRWQLSPKDDCHFQDPQWKQVLAHAVGRVVETLDELLMHKTRLDNFFGCWILNGKLSPFRKVWHWVTDHDPWEYLPDRRNSTTRTTGQPNTVRIDYDSSL